MQRKFQRFIKHAKKNLQTIGLLLLQQICSGKIFANSFYIKEKCQF